METRSFRISKPLAIALALIFAGVCLRLLPHTANFAPVGAIALFGGAVLGARVGWWLPVAVMAVSDVFLGFHGTMLFTWGGFLLVGLFGATLRHKSNWVRVPVGALGSAVIFYVISNFGVWVEGRLYAHTLQGLAECYIAALPFLKTSLTADFAYSAALFGAFSLATQPAKNNNVQQAADKKQLPT